MNVDRNLYFSDINNNIENKVFYNNEYKTTVMPSIIPQTKIKKEYIYIGVAAIIIIIIFNNK